MKKWISIGLVVLCCSFAWAEITVTNLVVMQREGTKLVDIFYDVSCDTTNEVSVELSVSNEMEMVGTSSLNGDVGEGVSIGTNKTMVWDMGVDWNGNISSAMVYAITVDDGVPPVSEMVRISKGSNGGVDPSFGAYSLTVDAYYMDKYVVTKAKWDVVANWAYVNGYDIMKSSGSSKESSHPVYFVTWWECVKWCNARSEREGLTPCYTVSGNVYRSGESSPECDFNANGFRLPTSDEWEYAARGGLSGKRFPWGDTVTHSEANYYSYGEYQYSYDLSPTSSFHPSYDNGDYPYTSPSRSFSANGYGLYNMVGNVSQWCWDTAPSSYRVCRGGWWYSSAADLRCGYEGSLDPVLGSFGNSFRTVSR